MRTIDNGSSALTSIRRKLFEGSIFSSWNMLDFKLLLYLLLPVTTRRPWFEVQFAAALRMQEDRETKEENEDERRCRLGQAIGKTRELQPNCSNSADHSKTAYHHS